jgi:hypothetical protein
MTAHRLATLGLCVTLVGASALRAQSFDFESTALGTTTPFSVTLPGGLTAAFLSLDGSPFTVVDEFQEAVLGFAGLEGHVLLDADPAQHTLVIGFSNPLTAIGLNFAIDAQAGSLMLQAFNGGTLVGSTTQAGAVPPGHGFAEGFAFFSPIAPAVFDRVRLTTTTTNFAVDNITVAAVPEPATLWLVGSGVLAAGLARRERRRRR